MTIYFQTAKGSHRHADFECANQRRAIASGDPIAIPADKVSEWAPCEHCTAPGEQAAHAAKVAAKASAQCANAGVTHPKRVQSECISCGKRGTVNRSTGSLRAHKAAN